jgi:hypothetical protein
VLQIRGTVRLVSPFIVVITRRDSRGQEHHLAIETLASAPDDRRRGPFRVALPSGLELPAWHEHEEDD